MTIEGASNGDGGTWNEAEFFFPPGQRPALTESLLPGSIHWFKVPRR